MFDIPAYRRQSRYLSFDKIVCVAALVKSEVVGQGRLRLINLHNFQVNEDFLLSNYS